MALEYLFHYSLQLYLLMHSALCIMLRSKLRQKHNTPVESKMMIKYENTPKHYLVSIHVPWFKLYPNSAQSVTPWTDWWKSQLSSVCYSMNRLMEVFALQISGICKRGRCSVRPQQYSTNQNPRLSRNNFLANLMHGHSNSSWSGSSLPEITEQRIFHVYFIASKSD